MEVRGGKPFTKPDFRANRKPLLGLSQMPSAWVRDDMIFNLDLGKPADIQAVCQCTICPMAFNFIHDMKSPLRLLRSRGPVAELGQQPVGSPSVPVNSAFHQWGSACLSTPVLYIAATVISAALSILGSRLWGLVGMGGLVVWPALAVMHFELSGATWAQWSDPLPKVLAARFGQRPTERLPDVE
jgi:hypothetical protein